MLDKAGFPSGLLVEASLPICFVEHALRHVLHVLNGYNLGFFRVGLGRHTPPQKGFPFLAHGHFEDFLRLHGLHSIWQLSVSVLPSSTQGVM